MQSLVERPVPFLGGQALSRPQSGGGAGAGFTCSLSSARLAGLLTLLLPETTSSACVSWLTLHCLAKTTTANTTVTTPTVTTAIMTVIAMMMTSTVMMIDERLSSL